MAWGFGSKELADLRSDETKYHDAEIARAVARERERIAAMVERLDNTMMNQVKLAAHIRERR